MTEAWLLALGGIFMDDQPARALATFQEFEQWGTVVLGEDHYAVVQAVSRQAWCHARLGNHTSSCAMYQKAQEMLRRTARENTVGYREISQHLDIRCRAAERLKTGELTAQEAGPHTLVGLPRFNPLGEQEDLMDKLEVLAGQITEAAERLEIVDPFRVLSEDADAHGLVVGKVLREIGEFELAVETITDYVEWASGKFGPVSDSVMQALRQLAYCHNELGDFSEACRLNRQVVDLLRKLEPENQSIETLEKELDGDCPPVPEKWLYGLADQWGEADLLEDAAAALETYERWATREYGGSHRYVADALAMRGYCYERLQRKEDACEVYGKLLSLASELESAPASLSEIEAFVAEHCGRPPLDRTDRIPLGERWGPPLFSDVERNLESIGDTLAELDHHHEAASAYQEAQAGLEREENPDLNEISQLLIKRATCHVHTGEQELACRLYERAVGLIEASDEPDQKFLRSADEYLREHCS